MEHEILKTNRVSVTDGVESKVLDVPVYHKELVPPDYCSRYARLAAEQMFGKKYPKANAWDISKVCSRVANVGNNEELIALAEDGILKPGMIIGLYYPDTEHNNFEYPYTHVSLFLGLDSRNRPLFAEQFGDATFISEMKDLKRYRAREILDVSPKKI
jgi:hypothetical protein